VAIGPVERFRISQGEPVLSRLLKGDLAGSVEISDRPGRWLIDRLPARDYFTGDFIVEARQVLSPHASTERKVNS
jgi:hypothetical protein